MMKKIAWVLFIVLACIVGLYPAIYFVIDRQFGLLASKTAVVLTDKAWNLAFYTHIVLGGVALLTGWSQFNSLLRKRRLHLHRQLGKLYVVAVCLSALAGIYIGFFATGGLVASLGFISLGIVWFSATVLAYTSIRHKRIALHQQWMIYSYAACFAAVTLRIWLPLLQFACGNFITAYLIVSWLCWVPNILVAYFIIRHRVTAVAAVQ